VAICKSACRCTIRHPSRSRRKTIVARSSFVESSAWPARRERMTSVCTTYARSAATILLISCLLRLPSENFELTQSSRAATFGHPRATPPKPPQRLTSSAWDHSAQLDGIRSMNARILYSLSRGLATRVQVRRINSTMVVPRLAGDGFRRRSTIIANRLWIQEEKIRPRSPAEDSFSPRDTSHVFAIAKT
jgi:hypothetical protein